MARGKDKTSVILYGNMLKAIAKLPAENCLEMMQAISAYVDGAEFKFTSPILEAWFSDMIETFKRDAEAFKATCVKRSEAGKIGNKRRWKEKIEEDGGGNVKDSQGGMDNRKVSQSIAKYRKTSQSIANIADTETETDIKRKNIDKKENGFCLNDFIAAAKLPDVSATEEQARECFDFYAAQGFLKSNGQPITAVAPLLRAWKRREGMFSHGANKNGPQGKNSPDLRTLKLGLKFILGGSDNLLPHEQKALACQDAESFKRYVPDEYALIVDTLKEPFSKMKDFVNKNLK